jgi:hypothetical protein
MSFLPQLGGWRNYYYNFRIRWRIFKLVWQLKRRPSDQEIHEIAADTLKETQMMYAVVGIMTVAWAEIELYLDVTNGVLILHKSIKQKGLPVSLRLKIAFFRKGFESIPELADFRERASKIVNDLNRLKVIRHDIIHGTAMKRTEFGVRKILRLAYAGKDLEMRYTTYRLSDIVAAANQMAHLKEELRVLYLDVLRILHPDAAKQASGEF